MMQRFYSALALLAIIATWTSCSEALSIYNQATVRPGNGKFGSISGKFILIITNKFNYVL